MSGKCNGLPMTLPRWCTFQERPPAYSAKCNWSAFQTDALPVTVRHTCLLHLHPLCRDTWRSADEIYPGPKPDVPQNEMRQTDATTTVPPAHKNTVQTVQSSSRIHSASHVWIVQYRV